MFDFSSDDSRQATCYRRESEIEQRRFASSTESYGCYRREPMRLLYSRNNHVAVCIIQEPRQPEPGDNRRCTDRESLSLHRLPTHCGICRQILCSRRGGFSQQCSASRSRIVALILAKPRYHPNKKTNLSPVLCLSISFSPFAFRKAER